MWIVFDQQYRNSYVFAAELFPRMPIPQTWYEAGIAVRADNFAELAFKMRVPEDNFSATVARFNENAFAGEDHDFERGRSACDRYYGDPTITPNPNLRPLVKGPFYAVKMVLSDLGTCGGLRADDHARVLREDGTAITGFICHRQHRCQRLREHLSGRRSHHRTGVGLRLHRRTRRSGR